MSKKCVNCGKSTGVTFPSDSLFPGGAPGNDQCIACRTKRETHHMLALLPTDDTDPGWERLSEKEQEFLDANIYDSFCYNFNMYGQVTEKQFQWLESIYFRLRQG